MTHAARPALIALLTLAALSSPAWAQTVQVRDQSASVVNVYLGASETPQQVVTELQITFQEETLSGDRVLRTYTSLIADGQETLAAPASVLIEGKLGAERSYRPIEGVTARVKEHLEGDLKEDRFLPLLETTPQEASGPWDISLDLASNLLEQKSASFLSGSKAGGLLRTRDDEGRAVEGVDFRFRLNLSEIVQSELRIARGATINAQVRLEPSPAGLMIAMQSTLRGRALAIRNQALPAGTRVEGTTTFRRDYTQLNAAGQPTRLQSQPLTETFARFLGRTESAGLAGSLRR